MGIEGGDGARFLGGPSAGGALPHELMGVLGATGYFGKNFCRMQAKRAGYPLLWQPKNPRRWWGWAVAVLWVAGMTQSLVSDQRAGYAWGQSLSAARVAVGYLSLLWPFPVVGLGPLLLRRWERRRRLALSPELFAAGLPEGLPEVDPKLAAVVRYALARVGGFPEETVRPDERSITFMRLTLIRYPLLHEFSYYVSDKLGQIDAMSLGDYMAERRRRTIPDLVAGVHEFLQVGRNRGDE